MNIITKITIVIAIIIILCCGLPWLFNHVSVWLAFILTFVSVALAAQFVYSQFIKPNL